MAEVRKVGQAVGSVREMSLVRLEAGVAYSLSGHGFCWRVWGEALLEIGWRGNNF
jgi:hypothetical protein